ncbi:MAG: acyltransferase [Muribaculaceae bacterium]|nr:acyltransferase [Muribaculaceae bacterium]
MASTDTLTPAAKPRYELLDGLRGVAALMVILYHVGEAFATSPQTQVINHGYLAVDFFFVLSGFVIGYAYDGRWQRGLTAGRFMLQRIVRLQPMVIVGVLLGVLAFAVQGCEKWDGSAVSTGAVVLSLVLGLLMLPSLPGSLPEVRGNGEMFPLNGPSWSLFFEYIGSVMYAVVLHRLPRRVLAVFTALAGAGLAWMAIGNASGYYHTGVGWTAADHGFWLGLLRMTFSFSAGLLMSRGFRPMRIRGAFWICSALIAAVLSVPYVCPDMPVLNGVYDAVCTLVVFPLIVYIGASGRTTDPHSARTCEFLGAISYPLYIIHYPFMYLFYWWVWSGNIPFAHAWPMAAAVAVVSIALAWLFLKYYDEPVRRYLSRKFTRKEGGRL